MKMKVNSLAIHYCLTMHKHPFYILLVNAHKHVK